MTRGGLGAVLNEVAESSGVLINIKEGSIPVDADVKGFCEILGLDPLYMGNEGKMICIVPGGSAEIIGAVEAAEHGKVVLTTRLGCRRVIDVLYGEGLPKICQNCK